MQGGVFIVNNISSYLNPLKIICGVDSRICLGQEIQSLGGSVVFVSTDKGVVDAGLLVDILDSLNKQNLAYVIFDEVTSPLTVDIVERGLEIYRNEQCDILLAVGGSSTIDNVKAISYLLSASTFTDPCEIINIHHASIKNPSIITVPTTAGSRAEVLGEVLLTDSVKNANVLINNPVNTPRIAIYDPILLQTLPAHMASLSGMVSLSHAVEGYISLGSFDITDLVNLRAIELVAKYARRFVANRKDLEAASGMQKASLYSALGSSNSGLGNTYAMANSLYGHLGVNYGLASAVILPHVMEFNEMACPDKLIKIARCFGEVVDGIPSDEGALKAVRAVSKLARDISITSKLIDLPINNDQVWQFARKAKANEAQQHNPRETTTQDFFNLFNKILNISTDN